MSGPGSGDGNLYVYKQGQWLPLTPADLSASDVGALGAADTTDVITEGSTNLYNRVPAGGSAGQSLVKASGTDYDATWSDRARIVNTDGAAGKTFYVGSVDPDGVYTLAVGDVWIEVPS